MTRTLCHTFQSLKTTSFYFLLITLLINKRVYLKPLNLLSYIRTIRLQTVTDLTRDETAGLTRTRIDHSTGSKD